MLEPLFRCNLACAGCGKIDYPEEILDRRLSPEGSMAAIDECGAPVVSIAGGEPLIHQEMPRSSVGLFSEKSLSTYARTRYSFLDAWMIIPLRPT